MSQLSKEVREYMSEMGRKGGSSTSERKKEASRRNAKKYPTEAGRKQARADANRRYYEKKQGAKEETGIGENLPLFENIPQ